MFLKIEKRIACGLKVGVHLSSFGAYILHEAGVKIIFKVVGLIKKLTQWADVAFYLRFITRNSWFIRSLCTRRSLSCPLMDSFAVSCASFLPSFFQCLLKLVRSLFLQPRFPLSFIIVSYLGRQSELPGSQSIMHIWSPSLQPDWPIHQTFIFCPVNSVSICLSLPSLRSLFGIKTLLFLHKRLLWC